MTWKCCGWERVKAVSFIMYNADLGSRGYYFPLMVSSRMSSKCSESSVLWLENLNLRVLRKLLGGLSTH